MLIFLLSTAFAGVWLEESELLLTCEADSDGCAAVLAEVIDSSCLGRSEAADGAIETRYRATLRIIEVQVGRLEASEITLFSVNYDYSNSDSYPSCYDNDPGHPVGEIARYYLSTSTINNDDYVLYESMAFFSAEDSAPGDLPDCVDIELSGDTEDNSSTEPQYDEEDDHSKSGCASLTPPFGYAALSLLIFGLLGRRKRQYSSSQQHPG